MTDGPGMVGAALAGAALGGVFFAGLWWTLRRGLHSRHPALWFGLSALLRTLLVLGGLYAVAGTDPRRWLAGTAGFVLVQQFSLRFARREGKDVAHAPES